MNLGDMLNKFDLKAVVEQIKNAPPEQFEKIKAHTIAVAACQNLFAEIIDCPSTAKLGFNMQDMAYFSLEVIASVAAICVQRYSKRTNNPKAFVDSFKVVFEKVYNTMEAMQK